MITLLHIEEPGHVIDLDYSTSYRRTWSYYRPMITLLHIEVPGHVIDL